MFADISNPIKGKNVLLDWEVSPMSKVITDSYDTTLSI